MDEARAIKLCLTSRDPAGFDYLHGQYKAQAYRHALGLTGNPEDALDVCQEAFAKAYASLPGMASLPAFYPWFYRILRNGCLNLARRRNTERKYALKVADPELDDDDPRDAVQLDEEKQRVWRALSALNNNHREILSLKYIADHSYEEIAELLKVPRGTVMSRLFNARKAFHEKYKIDGVHHD